MDREHEHTIRQIEDLGEVSSKKESLLIRKRWGLIALVGGSVFATVLLAVAACDSRESSPTPTATVGPTPTSVFEPHNVPFVNVELVDKNGDGVFNLFDARRQKGIDWLPGLDRDGQRGEDGKFRITENDIDVMREFLCLLPASPQNDINLNGHVTQDDFNIVNGYLNKEVSDDDNPNARLDELWGGNILDGNESDPATRSHRSTLEPNQADPACEQSSDSPESPQLGKDC